MASSRVQSVASTNYTYAQVQSWTGPAWPSAPTAGNVLLLILSIDKDGGASPGITAGWTIRGYANGLQSTLLIATKTATASETPPTVTWTAASTTGGGANGTLLEYTGVDTTSPVDSVVFTPYVDTERTGVSVGPLTPTGAGTALAAFSLDSMPVNGAASLFAPAATGWVTEALGAPGIAGGSGTPAAALVRRSTAAVAGTQIPSTAFTWTESDQAQGAMFVLRDASGGGGAATLVHRMVGMSTTSTVRVGVRTTGAGSVRLKVGTDSAVTQNVVFSTAATPDARGGAFLTVSGLNPGTQYYYRVAMTPSGGSEALDTASTVGRAKTAPSGQASFAFCFGSCCNNTDSAAMAAVAARGDDLFLHLGDLYYADGSGTGVQNFRDKVNAKIEAPNHAAVLATTPTAYTPSDHDGMNNNGNAGSDPTGWTTFNQVYRELIPTPTLPGGSTGVYYAFTWGRVRFVVLDTRSFATTPGATDNASKTRLGAAQKTWFKAEVTNLVEPVMVVVNADPWIGAAAAGDDGWFGYTTERTELANHISASGKPVVILGGDMHAVAADSGTNAPGGVTVFQASPLDQLSSQKGGPYSVSPYPSATNVQVQQYGRVVVTDTGSQIALAFTGYSANNTSRLTLTKTVTTTPALQPPTGLTATPVSALQIDLSWSAAAGATGYDIERDGSVIVSGRVGTTFSDTGLAAATTYTYRVRSVA